MPDFVQLPDRSLILRGDKPAPKSTMDNLKSAIAGFIDAMRPGPKPPPWWIEQQVQKTQARPPAVPTQGTAPASNAPALPAYNEWSAIEGEAANRERIKSQLGDFPQRMMASPLVEGRLF
jgi:hypothetical protein